jgi:formylglycine-generating enzyme required for sulfatase activity
MAPEQALDMRRADARSDIYSLGCSLYRLLTGMPPYQGETFTQLFLAHHEATIPSLAAARPDVPATLDAVFQKMVAKQPHERQQTMREVIADLEAVQQSGLGSADDELPNDAALTFPRGHTGATATQRVAAHTEMHTSPAARWTDTLRSGRGARIGLGAVAAVVLAAVIVALRHPDEHRTSTRPNDAPPPALAPFNAVQAREHQAAWAEHLGLPMETTNSIGMKLALSPPGEFQMGSTPEQVAWELQDGKKCNEPRWYLERIPAEGPAHRVKIGRPFYLGLHEVTQSEYQRVMGVNPSAFCAKPMASSSFNPPLDEQQSQHRAARAKRAAGQDTSRHPVETVSWNDAAEFCRRLSALPAERAANRAYRLPTEAEWEYACRAGTATRWSCGDNVAALKQCAWYGEIADDATHQVGEKRANPWSLYDMHGNVWEWCLDGYDTTYYERSPIADPQVSTGSRRSVRGGCTGSAGVCRSAYRHFFEPDKRSYHQGFRVCLAPAP